MANAMQIILTFPDTHVPRSLPDTRKEAGYRLYSLQYSSAATGD
ncbi:hypothetical protein [Selenomonas ruminantium]|nr:hypothetical protein [Selenomonas ruminantium]